jgi:hypothetical protein
MEDTPKFPVMAIWHPRVREDDIKLYSDSTSRDMLLSAFAILLLRLQRYAQTKPRKYGHVPGEPAIR